MFAAEVRNSRLSLSGRRVSASDYATNEGLLVLSSPPCLRAARQGDEARSSVRRDGVGLIHTHYPPRVLSQEPTAVTPHGGICGAKANKAELPNKPARTVLHAASQNPAFSPA
jgi:hypothetical protein